METIVKTFSTDREMAMWLADASNLENLKKDYPPADYHAKIDLIDKQIIVWPMGELREIHKNR